MVDAPNITRTPMLAVSYPTHNRKYYTGITLPRVIDECKSYGADLFVFDDNSTDMTQELLSKLSHNYELIHGNEGNTVWQLNWMLKNTDSKYIYCAANDILFPEGLFKFAVGWMENNPDVMSMMIEEATGLPYINEWEADVRKYGDEHAFTSSLGIHRREALLDCPSQKRFFGFQTMQNHQVKNGWKVCRMKGVGNTNLDCSPWSRQMEYSRRNYARHGLVGNERSVYE